MKIQLTGDITSALSHLALVGASMMLEEAGIPGVRLWWDDGAVARPSLAWAGDADLGAVVHAHAERHAQAHDWVQQTVTHEKAQVGLFSPRIKAATSVESWLALEQARDVALEEPGLTWLDHRMIGALGEPAYWLCTSKEQQPDLGASRWEMETRTSGKNFVANKLAPLARTVTGWRAEEVMAGLVGTRRRDEMRKDALDSRTPTGLTPPQATDNARAWCALWGIAGTTLVPQASQMSQTSGSAPRGRVHPHQMALPVTTTPTSPSKWLRMAASRQFDELAFASTSPVQQASLLGEAAPAGVLVRFPVDVRGSQNAPERVVLAGSIEVTS